MSQPGENSTLLSWKSEVIMMLVASVVLTSHYYHRSVSVVL